MPTRFPLLVALAVAGTACGRPAPAPAPAPVAPTAASADTVRVTVAAGTLVGTLQLPAGRAPFPAVLLISGSGPTDRDGNSAGLGGKNDGLRQLAESLAARGIASVRFDKRGVGASRMPVAERDVTLDTFVDDAVAWGQLLRGDARVSTLTVAGHSEGALIGLIAAPRLGADAVVTIAGPGRPLQDVLREQLEGRLPPPLKEQAWRILDSLAAGRTVDSTPPVLAALFRPSVQPFLISTFRHDPQALLRGLAIPALVAQGTTDLQVNLKDAERLAAARPDVRLLRVEGMNHVLKPVSGDMAAQLPSYRTPEPVVAPALVEGIAAFVRGVPRRGR